MHIDQLTNAVISCCIRIHSKIGPGCFEKVYDELLYYELIKPGFDVKRQLVMPISYETLYIPHAYKLDFLVENSLVLELKTITPLPAVAFEQIRTYLSLMELKYGMLLNFKVPLMKLGIYRVFNNKGKTTLS